jgi:hypothetical protein
LVIIRLNLHIPESRTKQRFSTRSSALQWAKFISNIETKSLLIYISTFIQESYGSLSLKVNPWKREYSLPHRFEHRITLPA